MLVSSPDPVSPWLSGNKHPLKTSGLIKEKAMGDNSITSFLSGNLPHIYNRGSEQAGFKSTSDLKERLDSIVGIYWDLEMSDWYNDNKDEYIFDIHGRMIEETNYFWSWEYNRWEPEEKYAYTFDSKGNLVSIIHSSYDWELLVMKLWSKIEYKYDDNGNILNNIEYSWNENLSKWVELLRVTYEYDGKYNLTRMIDASYDTTSLTWIDSYKTEYTYDASDNAILSTDFSWDPDSAKWVEAYKNEISYDENDNDTLMIAYYWDGYQWYPYYKNYSEYDINNLPVLHEYYYWNGEIYIWEGNEKTVFSYDANGRLTQCVNYYWDYQNKVWYISDKEDYSRDEKGNMIENISSDWDTTSSIWIPYYRNEIIYDLSLTNDEVALPYWWDEEVFMELDSPSKILSSIEYEWNQNKLAWDTSYIDTLYYSNFFSGPSETLCQADFIWTVDSVNTNRILFTDLSESKVVSWYWDFGDGTTSKLKNPSHLYKSEGIYTVTLSTIDATGFCTDSKSTKITIGFSPCNAYFDFTVDKKTATFLNGSEGDMLKYYWTFGDGTVSVLKDPVHQYMKDAIYEVSLSIRNADGTCSDNYKAKIELAQPVCDPDFTVFVDSISNTAYFKSKIQDLSSQYYWVFGNGVTSSRSNPVISFSKPGYYTATLTVTNKEALCSDSHKEIILIGSRGIDCKADFIYNVEENNKVFFSTRSSGEIKNYYWNFGDGHSSKDKDPTNTYTIPGYYNVCLTIYAENGIQSTICKTILAATEETEKCLAQFIYLVDDASLTISCTDKSFGSPNLWLWKYKDGWTSTKPDPEHTVAEPGYYIVHLNIKNSLTGCEDNTFGLINVNAFQKLKAGFGYIIDTTNLKADSYPVDFIGVSLGEGNKLKWDFGDGTYDSTTTSPTHEYMAPGEYDVCYTIYDQVTGDEDTYCQKIYVGISAVKDNYNTSGVELASFPNPFNKICKIIYTIPEKGRIDLVLYDFSGRKILELDTSVKDPGKYEIEFDGSGLESGLYYLMLHTQNSSITHILNVIR